MSYTHHSAYGCIRQELRVTPIRLDFSTNSNSISFSPNNIISDEVQLLHCAEPYCPRSNTHNICDEDVEEEWGQAHCEWCYSNAAAHQCKFVF